MGAVEAGSRVVLNKCNVGECNVLVGIITEWIGIGARRVALFSILSVQEQLRSQVTCRRCIRRTFRVRDEATLRTQQGAFLDGG